MNKTHRIHNLIILILLVVIGGIGYSLYRTKARKDKVMTIVQDRIRMPVIINENRSSPDEIAKTIDSLRLERKLIVDSLNSVVLDTLPEPLRKSRLRDLNERKFRIDNLEEVESVYSACLFSSKSEPINSYDGSLSDVSPEFCLQHAPHVGVLQWRESFPDSLHYTDGNVKGKKIGTGCLIAKDLFITAGHCILYTYGDPAIPKHNGSTITIAKGAQLLCVVFNYEMEKSSNKIRSDTLTFPVISVQEFPNEDLDYAILRLGPDGSGKVPGDYFSFEHFSGSPPKKNDVVAIIEQPDDSPNPFTKRITAGASSCSNDDCILYPKIGTEPAASGSPIFSYSSKELVGIHTGGDCKYYPGHGNQGLSIYAMLEVSKTLKYLAGK